MFGNNNNVFVNLFLIVLKTKSAIPQYDELDTLPNVEKVSRESEKCLIFLKIYFSTEVLYWPSTSVSFF